MPPLRLPENHGHAPQRRRNPLGTGRLIDAAGAKGLRVGSAEVSTKHANFIQADDDGSVDIKIGFNEPRKDGKRNAMIAGILEHGKSNQPARPFLSATKSAVKAPATQAMVDAFNKEVEGL